VSKHSALDRIQSELISALRKRRAKLGISMTQLAQSAGISLSMISFVERELRKPTLDTLLRMAAALDVDLGAMIQRASKAAKRADKD
jgi:transcriptional regulator with XRE-family HTH domain